MEFLDLFRSLSEKKVRYLICGGLAVNIYGIPRMTADIDIILDFTKDNIEKFEKTINSFHYKALIPMPLVSMMDDSTRLKMVREKNLIAYSYYNTVNNIMNIDVLVDAPLKFEDMWKNKTTRKIENTEIYIVSVDHLIKLKEYAGRVQDKQDVIMLNKFKTENS